MVTLHHVTPLGPSIAGFYRVALIVAVPLNVDSAYPEWKIAFAFLPLPAFAWNAFFEIFCKSKIFLAPLILPQMSPLWAIWTFFFFLPVSPFFTRNGLGSYPFKPEICIPVGPRYTRFLLLRVFPSARN